MKIICFSMLIMFLAFSKLKAKISIKNENVDSLILYEKFINNPNYINALNLAQYFYSIKDYKNSSFWAIEANEIEYLEKDAWLIFIDSKMKQGQIDQALKAKEEYEKVLNASY